MSLLKLCKCPLNEEENGKCLVQKKGGKSDGVCRDGWGPGGSGLCMLGCAVVLVTILPVIPSLPAQYHTLERSKLSCLLGV